MIASGGVSLRPLLGFPRIERGADLVRELRVALAGNGVVPAPHDVLVLTSKVVSRAEGRFVDLRTVAPTPWAQELAHVTGKDPRLVEVILRESSAVSRAAPGVLVTRHRLGMVVAHAGVDLSNAAPGDAPEGSGPWALLLPRDPDATARHLREHLAPAVQPFGVVISDSFGRPFRKGSVGVAVGSAGFRALADLRGRPDLDGRPLEHTEVALADQLACAADLVAGQADEGTPAVWIRGVLLSPHEGDGAAELSRDPANDLYA